MRNEGLNFVKIFLQLWLFYIAAIASADALVLGEIRVNSTLGQPLRAQIAFIDLSEVDALQLKIRLASSEDYKKLGLQYPDSSKFNFQVINEQGALLPFIRISTPYPIDDPFINLLVEVSSPAGRLIKAYTFLLDPSPDFFHSPAAEPSVAIEHHEAFASSKFGKNSGDQVVKPVKSAAGHKKHHAKRKIAAQAERQDSRSQMKLAMSLSISSHDPSEAAGASRDALQEDLISKEKSLEELKLQIGEMQMVIQSLQDKRAASSVVSAVPDVAAQPAKLVVLPGNPQSGKTWLNAALAFAVLVLGGILFAGYRKYKRMHGWQHGPFDGLNEEETAEVAEKEPSFFKPALDMTMPVSIKQAPAASLPEAPQEPPQIPPFQIPFEKVTFGEQPVQMPAYTEHAVPPEYAMLMEAKRYLRAGNDQLAEEALIRAIGVNPKNLFGYQALLRIYEARGDVKSFENTALRLKENSDEAAFNEAAEMGRKLDPDNPLYI